MGLNNAVNLEEQIGVLSSFMLNLETINKLDWKIAWFQEDFYKSTDIYKNSPFEVILLENQINLPGIPVYITKKSNL